MAKHQPVHTSKTIRIQVQKAGKSSFWSDPSLVWSLLAILAITVICFIPTFSNDFVTWDDDVNLLDNPFLRAFDWPNIKGIFTQSIIGNYNPLPTFTLAIEKAIFGLNPVVYHTSNLMLHLIGVVLAYRIALSLELSRTGAFMVALLFGMHPMRVESVAWVTERKDVLFGVFYFAALLSYIRSLQFPERKKHFVVWTYIFFILSLFSKIQAVALPLSLLVLDYYWKRPIRFKLIIEKIPYFILSLGVGILGIYLLSVQKSLISITHLGFLNRLLLGAYVYCTYVGKFIFPWIMSPLYSTPTVMGWAQYLSPLGVITVFAWAVYAYRQKQYKVVFGLAFFSVNVVFLLQILGAGAAFMADRFTYIPYFGLFVLLAVGYDQLIQRYAAFKTGVHLLMLVYFGIFAYMTWTQTEVWKNGETLWTHALKYDQKNSISYNNRARYYTLQKIYAKALPDYKEAIRLDGDAKLYNSLGKMLFESGNAEDAIKIYNQGIAIDSSLSDLWVNRGGAYGMLGNLQLGLNDLNRGLSLDPNNLMGYINRSLVLEQMGKTELALLDHGAYLRLNPYNDQIWYEKGIALRILARDREAIPNFDQAIRLKPEGIYYLERSKAYYQTGNKQLAFADAQAALSKGVQIDETYRKLIGL